MDDSRDFRGRGVKDAVPERRSTGMAVEFISAPGEQGQDDRERRGADCVNAAGAGKHLALGRRSPLRIGKKQHPKPVEDRRKLPVLGPGVPHGRAIRQQQFRAAPAGLLLFSRQPVAERVDQVVVGELVVEVAQIRVVAFRVNGRYEAQLGVQQGEKVLEIACAVLVAGGGLQLRRGGGCGP